MKVAIDLYDDWQSVDTGQCRDVASEALRTDSATNFVIAYGKSSTKQQVALRLVAQFFENLYVLEEARQIHTPLSAKILPELTLYWRDLFIGDLKLIHYEGEWQPLLEHIDRLAKKYRRRGGSEEALYKKVWRDETRYE